MVSALVLPPVPGLILILLGASDLAQKGWELPDLVSGVMLIWFSSCNVTARGGCSMAC